MSVRAVLIILSVTIKNFEIRWKKQSTGRDKNSDCVKHLNYNLNDEFQLVIHDQTMNYLTENNILYRHQSGFHKNHSTDTSLACLTDKILIGFDSGLLSSFE